ncbi:MAG: NTP transferase domain-containing protein [Nitrososphaerota archaeon]|nr:NTP transferase domain-containing protein [Candidatus Calditenuaceae archaeon]MDW8073014.1 NTP transferase domain-containing protein [Nitrososphaerota archaeon]
MTAKAKAVIMCGGKGRRMAGLEKPLIKILERPLIDYALNALIRCHKIEKVDFVSSQNTPATTKYLIELGFEPFVGSGSSFLDDLLEYLRYQPQGDYLIVSCDIPTIKPHHIEAALKQSENHNEGYLMYVLMYENVKGLSKIPSLINREGVDYQPAGLRYIRRKTGRPLEISDPRLVVLPFWELGVNVNTVEDIVTAELILKSSAEKINS